VTYTKGRCMKIGIILLALLLQFGSVSAVAEQAATLYVLSQEGFDAAEVSEVCKALKTVQNENDFQKVRLSLIDLVINFFNSVSEYFFDYNS
jgi:hypothetical protein